MKTIITFAASLGLASAVASAVTPFLDINFNGDTIGAQPATGPAGNPISMPTGIGGYTITDQNVPPTADNGSLVVGNVGGMTKAAVLTTNPLNGELGALYLDTGFSQASQSLTMSFDINVANAPTISTTQTKTLNGGPGTAGILLGMNTFGTAQGTRFAAAPTSVNGGVFAIRSPDNTDLQSFFSYVEGQTYSITLVSDYNTGLVSTYVDGNFTGNLAFATGAQANTVTQEFFFHLNGDLGSESSVAIDNIVASVPEPTTLAGLAGAAALVLRRRRA
jgi:hypothetical protein